MYKNSVHLYLHHKSSLKDIDNRIIVNILNNTYVYEIIFDQ